MSGSYRRPGTALALAVLLSGFALAPSTSAQAAAPPIQLTKAYYNSPGSDTRSNSSLNAEYVVLRNNTRASVGLAGWTVRDRSGKTYSFRGTSSLGAGRSLTLHTGRGSDSATHRYWGSAGYIWNNTGDTAYVRNRAGRLVDACSWGSTGASTAC